jgi:4-hydroxy-2-oxoheptanedioate aldolase
MSFLSATTSTINNPHLRLLNALRSGSKPITTFMGLPSLRTAQMVAQTGVDVYLFEGKGGLRWWVFYADQEPQGIMIDCEHSHISDGAMHSATAAIASMGVSPLVRIRMTHTDLIKRALDAGAQ